MINSLQLKTEWVHWIETEYAFKDSMNEPMFYICEDTQYKLVDALMDHIERTPKYQNTLLKIWSLTHEWLANMIEFNTRAWSYYDVLDFSLSAHDIITMAASDLWAIISTDQPIISALWKEPVPWKEWYVSDVIAWLESKKKGLWFNWWTTSIHHHCSIFDDKLYNSKTFQLYCAQIYKLSQEMKLNPNDWHQKYLMSNERKNSWWELVNVRAQAEWEYPQWIKVVWRFDQPIVNGEIPTEQFVFDRYFESQNPKILWNPKPQTDHFWFAIKQPVPWIYTAEWRLSNGPWDDKAKITEAFEMYISNAEEAREIYQSKISSTKKLNSPWTSF